jgi:hypothetical protein
MKNSLIISTLVTVLLTGCQNKKKEKSDLPISALSIIKGQLNKLDSSMYAFMKLERNGNKTDTTYLKREEVRKLAEPFLALPDITDKKTYKKYSEERLIDAEQGTLSITSTLKDNEDAEIQKQMLIVGMGDGPSGNVKSIFIETARKSGDATIEQKLFWELDKYFTVLIEKDNQPEKNNFMKVVWQ